MMDDVILVEPTKKTGKTEEDGPKFNVVDWDPAFGPFRGANIHVKQGTVSIEAGFTGEITIAGRWDSLVGLANAILAAAPKPK